MFTTCYPLILASASPRRQEFLSRLGLQHRIVPADIDETSYTGESPHDFCRRMATAKAQQVAEAFPDACVIGADTVVALNERIFGKPSDAREAMETLRILQGRTHQVITGFAIVLKKCEIEVEDSATTLVTFDRFSDAVLQAYVDSGEPMDKAGAYGIQGRGGFLIRTIHGSCSNVVGLPVNAVVRLLLKHHLLRLS